ncbi:hypothetical protein [Kribbella sp. NPDC006257]|uniref:hypothetical protein n=1 Tax=Kribbella sp. NPDC006257 TaxID=3156738 RepID=UPI0033A9EA14
MANHVRRFLTGAIGVGCLLSTASLIPATAAETSPIGEPKKATSAKYTLPLDITGDAALSEARDSFKSSLKSLSASEGATIWDKASNTLTVQFTSDAAINKAQTLRAKSATPFKVKYVQVKYTENELSTLSDKLFDDQKKWAGASGIGGGYDPVTNRVLLQVDPKYKDSATLVRAIKGLKDPRVTLQYVQATTHTGTETRVVDFAPWTVGATITSSPKGNGCTLGWAWRMKDTNEVVGSTARHCADLDWYNNGHKVGTVFKSAKAVDSALMHGSTYSPTVFVGNQTTGEVRPVVGFDGAWSVGDQVAMSGATTGLNVSSVKVPSYTLPSCAGEYAGLKGVLMATHPTAGGDSGGPWLTTQKGTGSAIAHGQHWGYGCASGYTGSFFIKLNDIAGAQNAGLLIQ